MGEQFIRIRGVNYFVKDEGNGPAVLLLHGFTGSHAVWSGLMQRLAFNYHMIAPDLLGHGQSDAPGEESRYQTEETIADLLCLLDVFGARRVACLGYSMGGRIGLSLATSAPDSVAALVLESASPGLTTDAERTERVERDRALANRIERIGVSAFIDEWERIPLFHSQLDLPSDVWQRQREIRLEHSEKGLAGSLRGIGTGAQPSNWQSIGEFNRPVCIVTGELDVKFKAIGEQMKSLFPNAEFNCIAGAGHTVHLERPQEFLNIVLRFLAANEPW